jgi:hypothetical protein
MKKRTLEIDENLDFQRKEWVAQRIGLWVLAVFVFGALIGLTGVSGPLTHGEAGDRLGSIHLEYDRIVRRGTDGTLTLHLRTSVPGDIQFWVSAAYFESVTVERVVPQPYRQSVEHERHVYTIHAGSPEIAVMVDVQHNTIGRVDAEIGIVSGPSVRFTQWLLF